MPEAGQDNSMAHLAPLDARLSPLSGMNDQASLWFNALLPHGGVSLWWEDWSPVAGLVAKLRAARADVVSYCSKHPGEYQALHAQIMVTDVNEAALRMMRATDKTEMVGRLADIVPFSVFTFPQWLAAITDGSPVYRGQTSIQRMDGELCDCLIAAALPAELDGLSRLAVLVADITEYRGRSGPSVLSAIQHASRLSAMGALTASISHEIKNPLAAVVTNAGACRRWLRKDKPNLEEAEAALDAVVRDANQARDIVDRNLSFLRPVPSGKVALDIVSAVNNVIVMIIGDLRRSAVEVNFHAEEPLPQVFADPIQVQQVLMNLILNAAQALAGTAYAREIVLRIKEQDGHILVEVSDFGPGIRPEQFSRLFEPFYSTKAGGIGLGLAVCRSCVEENGGRIWAKSTFNGGASFFFTLPALVRA